MIDELRQLADVLSKATPGPWDIEFNDTLISAKKDGKWHSLCGLYGHSEVWRRDNATAICAARNSEALLRQAADEIERLRKVVKEAREFAGFYVEGDKIHCNEGGWGYKHGHPTLAAELEARP